MASGALHQHRAWPGCEGKSSGQQQSALVCPLSQSKEATAELSKVETAQIAGLVLVVSAESVATIVLLSEDSRLKHQHRY